MNKEQVEKDFKKYFGIDLKQFRNESMESYGQIFFDLYKFEDWLMGEHGYQQDMPMKDFIVKKFGEDAEEVISTLVNEAEFLPPDLRGKVCCKNCGRPLQLRLVKIFQAFPVDDFLRYVEQKEPNMVLSDPEYRVMPVCECGQPSIDEGELQQLMERLSINLEDGGEE